MMTMLAVWLLVAPVASPVTSSAVPVVGAADSGVHVVAADCRPRKRH
jgi:hypothetical protein